MTGSQNPMHTVFYRIDTVSYGMRTETETETETETKTKGASRALEEGSIRTGNPLRHLTMSVVR
ncbi:hypothetical protein IMCC20628_01844 [Hoeflea sp. IMCC20628]|nr:hypothetical protein IMCC20628_01844 [Hoeflea sp. IMCC20628]